LLAILLAGWDIRHMPEDPPWLSEWLQSKKPEPSVPTEAIEAYLKSLNQAPTPAVSQSIATPKSQLDRVNDALSAVRKAISQGKVTKMVQLQWAGRIRDSLRPIYGDKGPLIGTLKEWVKEINKTELPANDFIARVEQVEHFVAGLNAPGASGSLVTASRVSLVPATKNVFIIHGHDEPNQLRLRIMVKDEFKLNPVILLNRPGKSATTIEKFEDYAETCSYAIALFTRDDRIVKQAGSEYWQPRPNVIFETGWFVGRLGRGGVLILLEEGVKIHSDFDGVNRIQFQNNVEDKFRSIQAELEAARLI
jgi:hypothetical protein